MDALSAALGAQLSCKDTSNVVGGQTKQECGRSAILLAESQGEAWLMSFFDTPFGALLSGIELIRGGIFQISQ